MTWLRTGSAFAGTAVCTVACVLLWPHARDAVDAPALENAIASGSMLRPGQTLTAIKASFRTEQAGGLVRLAKDVGRVGEKAGTRGALDALGIAEGPKDVARAARLAESKGGQTRAILKILGRGALLLAAGAFNLALWVFGALLALFGLLSSIKATTERLTQSWLLRRKARRLRRQAAATLAGSTVPLAAALPTIVDVFSRECLTIGTGGSVTAVTLVFRRPAAVTTFVPMIPALPA